MNIYNSEIKFNKSKSENSEKKTNTRKQLISRLVTLTLISLLISAPVTIFSVSAVDVEPTLETILDDLGFTNIAFTGNETFSPGMYNITLMAEFAGYHSCNVLSYYAIETSDFQTIFTGPKGATGDGDGGYVIPQTSKYFESDTQFGLSLLTTARRYFTQHYLNPDTPEQHSKVYKNLDNPSMFLIGFENKYGGCDRDYNDMVFSMVLINPPEIVSVTRSPETPNYDQLVTITAQVTRGSVDINSVILSYQIGSASWTNVTMSLESSGYVADIAAQYNNIVNYKAYASDTLGNSYVSALYSYTVGDFVPPVISNVVQVPNSPNYNEAVTVSANVIEHAEASGVKNVTLWYTTNTIWSFIDMTMQAGLWTANIPGQSPGTSVKYFVEAFDNAENSDKTSTFSYTVIVPNAPPIANFTSQSTVYTSETIDFDASASFDPDGYITIYYWNFGDGNVGSGVNANHSYVDNGEYFVTLTVTDNMGAPASKTASVFVTNRPPVADLITSTTILDKKETVRFDASPSYDPDGTIVNYLWNFGDGNTTTGVNVSHSYPNIGTYTVTLTVTDNDGATDTTTTTKTVRNQSPEAIFTESDDTVYVDDPIMFNASESYDPDGTIVFYVWDFGDGTTAAGVKVFHAYKDNGSYVVTLIVTDNDGATDTMTTTITATTKIVPNQSPVASFIKSGETVSTSESIHFDGSTSFDPDGTIINYLWNFGDGNTATGVVADHTYDDNSVYTVTLTVTDDDGATDSATATINVLNISPVASFTENATKVMQNETIHFDASASYDPDGTIVNYLWNFGDGNTVTGVTTDHAYSETGNYTVTVTLTVTDDDGASSSVVAELVIENIVVETETTVSLAVLSVIGLGITTLTATLLYGLFIRRKKKLQITKPRII